jgi:formylglycine-generating enzyme required for sulfatase activity
VDLKWDASTGSSGRVIKYDVFLDTLNPPVSKLSNLQVGTTYKTANLKVFKTYYWKIVANDGNGGISESEIRSFNTITYDFVKVEGGTFTMGCTSEQGNSCKSDENPTRSVTLSNFYMAKYEVTQFQWISVMGSNPSKYASCNDCPIDNVSWDDVQTFLTTLNTNTGKNYRLPTEAEWEYAARGGINSKGYKFSGSNDSSAVGWYWYYYWGRKPHIVGTKNPNELGIYDMSGNIEEWVSDWYEAYTGTSETNPTGPSIGNNKVLRGGSFYNESNYTRVSFRSFSNKGNRFNSSGFRLVLPYFMNNN